MDSAKNVRWIIPLKKFGMVRVKTFQAYIHNTSTLDNFFSQKFMFINFPASIIIEG